jgi:hypothetical protein
VISEDAAVKGNACRCGESGCVTWRCGFGVDMHLLKGGSDIKVRIAVGDETVSLVHADTILKVELDYFEGLDSCSWTDYSWSRP